MLFCLIVHIDYLQYTVYSANKHSDWITKVCPLILLVELSQLEKVLLCFKIFQGHKRLQN